jgi:hypothetical protein
MLGSRMLEIRHSAFRRCRGLALPAIRQTESVRNIAHVESNVQRTFDSIFS